MTPDAELEPLLTAGDVAKMFRVSDKTVSRWAAQGKISCIRTPGNHRRYRESDVQALLAGKPVLRAVDAA